jgi:hypothetical protein
MRAVCWLAQVTWDGFGLVVVYALLVLVDLLPSGTPTRPGPAPRTRDRSAESPSG